MTTPKERTTATASPEEPKRSTENENETDDVIIGKESVDNTSDDETNNVQQDGANSNDNQSTTQATIEAKDSPKTDDETSENGNGKTIEGLKEETKASEDDKGSCEDAADASTDKANDAAAKEQASTVTAESSTSQVVAENSKVKVHFVAVGAAPIMKKTKFQIGADQRFAAVTTFLRKMLKLSGSGSSLFLYCNSAFVPSPDELVGDLNDCFSIRGELVIHYSLQEAWG